MSEHAWYGDWLGRIHQRVLARGFTSLSEFVDARPTATLMELADELGEGVAAIQIEGALRDEAERAGRVEKFARDLLARRIRQRVANGWNTGERFPFERAWAFATWASAMQGLIDKASEEAVWKFLTHTDIPTGWLPEGPSDPFIEQAFAGVRFDTQPGK
jgi:hypothetical protein